MVLKVIGTLLFIGIALSGCNDPVKAGSSPANAPYSWEQFQQKTPTNRVLATVNGFKIDIDGYVSSWNKMTENSNFNVIYRGQSGKARFLEDLIKDRLLVNEAYRNGLASDPFLRTALERMMAEKMMLIKRTAIYKQVSVSEQEVTDYKKQLLRARMILIADRQKADDLYQKLLAGADFSQLAKLFSLDPSASENGGLTDMLAPDLLDPKLRTTLERLQPGEISSPVKTALGFQIIERIAVPTSFITDKSKNAKIEQLLKQSLVTKQMNEWFASLATETKIQRNTANMQEVFNANNPQLK